jgi:hypothetical protein
MLKLKILESARRYMLALSLGAALVPAMGCSLLGAAANPKVAPAMSEDASMYVVLRRSTTAEKIATAVDTAISTAPGEGDDGWIAKLGEPTAALTAEMKTASKRHHYAKAHAPIRVLPAEGWAKILPLDVQNGSGKTLFAMLGGTLGDQYAAVVEQKREIGELRGKVEGNKIAMKKQGIDDEDKKTLQNENDDLSSQADKLDEKLSPLVDKLIDSARESASKAQLGGNGAKLAAVVARLRQAVDDGKISNGSALVGIPRAIPGLKDTLENTVVSFIAEYIEDKTGKVPDMTKIKPQVSLENMSPKITISGLDPGDLLNLGLTISDFTAAITAKTKAFVDDSLNLPVRINRVAEVLALESKLLAAIQEGLKIQGFASPAIKDVDPIKVTPAQ